MNRNEISLYGFVKIKMPLCIDSDSDISDLTLEQLKEKIQKKEIKFLVDYREVEDISCGERDVISISIYDRIDDIEIDFDY